MPKNVHSMHMEILDRCVPQMILIRHLTDLVFRRSLRIYQALNPCIFSLHICQIENSGVGRVLGETLIPGPLSTILRPQ